MERPLRFKGAGGCVVYAGCSCGLISSDDARRVQCVSYEGALGPAVSAILHPSFAAFGG